jgi:sulfur transfer protein SufE
MRLVDGDTAGRSKAGEQFVAIFTEADGKKSRLIRIIFVGQPCPELLELGSNEEFLLARVSHCSSSVYMMTA